MVTDNERDLDIESRLTALETTVAALKKAIEDSSAHWKGYLFSVLSGATLALVLHFFK